MIYFMFLFSQVLSTPFLEKGMEFTDISSVIGWSSFYFYAVATFSRCSTSSAKEIGKVHLHCSPVIAAWVLYK